MAARLTAAFAAAAADKRPAFVTFVTAGYPHPDDSVEILLSLQRGGADVIEVGVPFSDPQADGPTIEEASLVALTHQINVDKCLELVGSARAKGLTVPVVFMGYYNPFLIYGEKKLMAECVKVGVDGFIVVDLPPIEAVKFRGLCSEFGLSYIPLIAPSTTDARIKSLTSIADSFIYLVSRLGVTGAQATVSEGLGDLLKRVKAHTTLPIAVGFGVSNREQFLQIGAQSEGVVIGSKIITTLKNAEPSKRAAAVQEFATSVTARTVPLGQAGASFVHASRASDEAPKNIQSSHILEPRFGDFGGQYAPEALVECLDEFERAYVAIKDDPKFWEEFRSHYAYMGRPSSFHKAERLTEKAGGAQIWLKREDLNHTGSHKINNAMGQILLALRLGKRRIIAETGAGQHGVATATVCAKFGLDCTIYMGAEDVRRQALNVFRIKLLGAKVVPVHTGSKTLKDAINEAMRDWVTNVETTHYLIGSAIGPHPFPLVVRDFQSIIGREARAQMLEQTGKLPDVVMACVGGGSNSIGMFHPFVEDKSVRIIGVEAGGDGVDTERHSATLTAGTPGVLHGTRTYLLQDKDGQIIETHSISAGLDYPGVGPEHAWLKDSGRAEYIAATDAEALKGIRLLSETEGIIPALETAHAIYKAFEMNTGEQPVSTSERNFVTAALREGLRVDGRGAYEFRDLAINLGDGGYGSAEVLLGKTRVLANVAAEVVRPNAANATEGFVHFNTSFSPMASPAFEQGRLTDEEVLISRMLEKALRRSRAIDTEGLCIIAGEKVWSIRIDIHVLDHEGNILDCACIAAIAALLHFRRPDITVEGDNVIIHDMDERNPIPLSIHHIPICITFGFFDNGDRVLVDPTHLEEQVQDGNFIVVVNTHRELCTMSKAGGATLDVARIIQCTEVAAAKAAEVTELVRTALSKSNEREKQKK